MGKKYSKIILATPGLVTYHRLDGVSSESSIGPDTALMTHNGSPASVSGLVLDGNGAKLYSGTTMDSSFSTAAFAGLATMSLECWFLETSLNDWSHVIQNDDWPTCRFQVLRNANSGNLTVGWRDGVGAADYGPQGPYNQLARNHMVVTADGTNIRLYVNGIQVGISGMAGVFGSGARTFRVNLAGGQQLLGTIDEAATYNVTLPAATVMKHYKAGLKDGVLSGFLLPV